MKITQNIPIVKLGIVAVSRDCFPATLSEKRKEAVVKCMTADGAEIFNSKIIVENETDVINALADLKANGVNALVIFLGNFGPEGPETMLAQKTFLRDPVLADGNRARRRTYRDSCRQKLQSFGRHVFKFGSDRRRMGGDFEERLLVVIGGNEVAVGNASGGAFGIRIEHPDFVSHLMRGGNEKSSQLTAAQHGKSRRRKYHDAATPVPSLDSQ